MAVLLQTSKGDIEIDLFWDECPKTCFNFIKLCSMKYYNNCLFHNIEKNFIAQTGDPNGIGNGGNSVWGILSNKIKYFGNEINPKLKHKVCMLYDILTHIQYSLK